MFGVSKLNYFNILKHDRDEGMYRTDQIYTHQHMTSCLSNAVVSLRFGGLDRARLRSVEYATRHADLLKKNNFEISGIL